MTAGPNANLGKKSSDLTANEVVENLQREYGSRFYRLARSKGLCHIDALDIVQTSLISMRQRLIDKGPVNNDVTYFGKIVSNQIAQHFRNRNNAREQPSGNGSYFEQKREEPVVERVIAPWPLRKCLMLKAASLAVKELEVHLREVYELAVMAELDQSDIAEILEKNPATVRAYLSIARRRVDERAEELLAELEQQQVQKPRGDKRS
jgi:RNA polymerase sigma factor (sigma-70 family)